MPHTPCMFEVNDVRSLQCFVVFFSFKNVRVLLSILRWKQQKLLTAGCSNQNLDIFCSILIGRGVGVWNVHHWHQHVKSYKAICLIRLTCLNKIPHFLWMIWEFCDFLLLFVGCSTSQLHARESQEQSNKDMCCHIQTEVADQKVISPRHSALTPGWLVLALTLSHQALAGQS